MFNPDVGITHWARVGIMLGLIPLKTALKAMECCSLLRLGYRPDSSPQHHVHAGTLTGESQGWAGSDKFS